MKRINSLSLSFVMLSISACAFLPTDKQVIQGYQAACEDGDMKECYKLGQAYRFDAPILGNKNKFLTIKTKAAEYFVKACEGGYMKGCTKAGNVYEEIGDKYDGAKTFSFFYDNDILVKPERTKAEKFYFKAITFYEKACEGGYMWGCHILGNAYLNGMGIARGYSGGGVYSNYTKASDAYKKACKLGNISSCVGIGTTKINKVLYE